MKRKTKLLRALLVTSISLLGVSSASAGQIWDGTSAVDDNWNTPANWDSDTLPTFANAITFAGTTRATNVNDLTADTTIGGLNFTNTTAAEAFSISGSGITLGGDITTTASSGLGITDTVSLAMILNGNRTITTNTLHNLTLSGIISETGGARNLTKSGAGTLTLTAANSYTGTTSIGGGTLALSGGNNRLSSTSTVAFTAASTFDIGSTSQTLAAVTVPDTTYFTSTITGSGTLTINGASDLQWGPGGIIANGTSTVVNLNGLSNFVYNSSANTFRVGYKPGATNSSSNAASSTVTLAANNTITASTLALGDQTANNRGGTSTLRLGAANTLNVANISIGFSNRSNATLNFNAASSAVTIRNTDGSSAVSTWNIGSINNPSSANVTFTDAVDLSNGTIDALVTSMTIGSANPSGATRAGTTNASFTMGASTGANLTVGTLTVGQFIGSGTVVSPATMAANGTFTLDSASGIANITTLTLATNTGTATGTGTKTVSGTFNLTDGTLNATTVQRGSQTGGTATATLAFNWTTGTIGNIAGGNLAITNVPITLLTSASHTFNISGSNTATVDANSPISGLTFGITKAGTGTLTLAASNTYTGVTAVSAGRLVVNGSTTSDAVVSATGTLGGSGTIGGSITVNGGTLSPGSSVESLASLSNTWNGPMGYDFEFLTDGTGTAGTDWDLLSITGSLDLTGVAAGGVDFNLVTMASASTPGLLTSWDPNVSHTWAGFVTTTTGITGFDPNKFSIDTTGFQNTLNGAFSVVQNGSNLDLQYAVVPEPSTLVLGGLSLLGFAGAGLRKRRLAK